ncbi:MAG: potassium channel protein [candidate division NC10 bacterium]|nr:potassium channel protein [candidate division NC10 bacterium]
MGSGRRLKISLLVLFSITVAGVLGYQLLEGLSFLDSLYMTIITISTVGFREVKVFSPAGRVFTLVLILSGVGAAFVAFVNTTQWVVEGELRELLGRRRVEKRIGRVKDHHILCGFGRVGRLIARELARQKVPFVLIEKDREALARYQGEDLLFIQGDATEEGILVQAGVQRAKGLITALPSDAENLLISLTARDLNPKLYIVARGEEQEGSERKLERAGANKVISPYHIGGLRMAHALLKPTVVDFMEIATHSESLELEMEEIQIDPASSLAHLALKDSGIRQEHGVIIVAIKKGSGQMIFNPAPDLQMEPGDRLVALGKPEQMKRLEERASS